MLTLRNYQNKIINEVRRLMSTGRKRICAVAPCG
nr:MAG TPA: putative DNA repair helicase [Caudoviricetes sp.]DAR52724.1 MAG TPA: putative DNA repair helicase [Caudoviricetes sp.]DAZ04763.1 MAG TPA: putative DNA repair helicase [Caudoviricetes sp.]